MDSPLKINELFKTNFTTTADAFAYTKKLRNYLDFETYYEVAKIAIGISLSQDTFPNIEGSRSQSIRGSNLFSDDNTPLWIGLLISNYLHFHPDEKTPVSMKVLQYAVRVHWARGVQILINLWNESGNDINKFWEKIIDKYSILSIDNSVEEHTEHTEPTITTNNGAIKLVIGNIINKNNDILSPFEHILNGKGYSPHVAIMGQAGSGKTRVLIDSLLQIRNQSQCPIILIDMGKGDLAKRNDLIDSLQATVICVPEQPIPLDIFYRDTNSGNDSATVAMENFRDAFRSLAAYKLGPKQINNIAKSVEPLFINKKTVTIKNIKDTIDLFYEENGIKEDGVVALINDLARRELFTPSLRPQEFFSKNWIITFANAREEAKSFSVCLLLSALDYYLKSLDEAPLLNNEFRNLRLIVAIDEARELLNYNHKALVDNIRLHRAKGLSIFLVSQSPDDYDGKNEDYLENIGLPICLKTNAKSTRTLKNMFKGNANFSTLQLGKAYSFDVTTGKMVLVDLK